jgi:hypothetical protein
MSGVISARIPPRLEQKLAEYCVKQGVTRTDVVVSALDEFLGRESGGISPFSLAADLIPERGVNHLQSENVRQLARKAFGAKRSR